MSSTHFDNFLIASVVLQTGGFFWSCARRGVLSVLGRRAINWSSWIYLLVLALTPMLSAAGLLVVNAFFEDGVLVDVLSFVVVNFSNYQLGDYVALGIHTADAQARPALMHWEGEEPTP